MRRSMIDYQSVKWLMAEPPLNNKTVWIIIHNKDEHGKYLKLKAKKASFFKGGKCRCSEVEGGAWVNFKYYICMYAYVYTYTYMYTYGYLGGMCIGKCIYIYI